MPRRAEVTRREVLPDPKYDDQAVAQFVNALMRRGGKSKARQVLYGAMEIIEEKMHEPPLKVLKQAMENVKPMLEVKSRRVGGATYQVPVEVRSNRRDSLGRRWLIEFATARSGKSMREKLAAEIMDAARGEGASIKRKQDVHRMAEANKAFAHYRW